MTYTHIFFFTRIFCTIKKREKTFSQYFCTIIFFFYIYTESVMMKMDQSPIFTYTHIPWLSLSPHVKDSSSHPLYIIFQSSTYRTPSQTYYYIPPPSMTHVKWKTNMFSDCEQCRGKTKQVEAIETKNFDVLICAFQEVVLSRVYICCPDKGELDQEIYTNVLLWKTICEASLPIIHFPGKCGTSRNQAEDPCLLSWVGGNKFPWKGTKVFSNRCILKAVCDRSFYKRKVIVRENLESSERYDLPDRLVILVPVKLLVLGTLLPSWSCFGVMLNKLVLAYVDSASFSTVELFCTDQSMQDLSEVEVGTIF